METLAPYYQFIFLFAFLIPMILFLLTQQNTLKRIHPDNRSMSPGSVWLQIIPLFGMVWQFFVVTRIADSLSRELRFRETAFSFEQEPEIVDMNDHAKPTYNIGLAYCILFCLNLLPILKIITTPAAIICWIIYWVRLSSYKNKLGSVSSLTA
jgi:hypothetical protein